MKKLLVGALAVGLMYSSTASAYHIIKQHRDNPVVAARPVAEELQNSPKAAKSKATPLIKDYTGEKSPTRNGLLGENSKTSPTRNGLLGENIEKSPRRNGLLGEGEGETATATATAKTRRELLTEEAPDSVRQAEVTASHSGSSYRMRSGDNVQLTVFGHEDLSSSGGSGTGSTFMVRPDGKLGLPLIGDVYCANRTVDDVVNEISTRLAEYIIDPKVSINITKLGTTRVYVLGEVRNQGKLELDKSHNLLDAIGSAGGFTQKSAKRKVYVLRKGMDKFVTQVDLLDLLRKGNQACNVELEEGDCVYLSSNHKFGFMTLLNTVRSIIAGWDDIDDLRK